LIEENPRKEGEADNKAAPEVIAPLVPITPIPQQDPRAAPQATSSQIAGQQAETNAENAVNELKGEMSQFERKMITLTVVGIAVAAITGAIMYSQFKIMADQTKILSDQSISAVVGASESERNTREQLRIAREQAKSTQSQVDVIQKQMREDQRAWVTLEVMKDPIFTAHQPVTFAVEVVNIGKSAARNVRVTIGVQKVSTTEAPRFDYKYAGHYFVGVHFPQHPETLTAGWIDTLPGSTEPVRPRIFEKDIQDIKEGKFCFAVYGRVEYMDIFDVPHTTSFCQLSLPNPFAAVKSSEKCGAYNQQTLTKQSTLSRRLIPKSLPWAQARAILAFAV
jgi:hypothetical protein